VTILHGRELNGKAWLVSLPGTVVPVPPPLLAINNIVGLIPGGISAATLSFSRGAPATLSAVMDGAPLTIASFAINTAAGSGAAASGTASFTFTTPAAGTHAIVASGTGLYAAQSNSYILTTAPVLPPAIPSLTITSITGLAQGGTSLASLSFANGAPSTITATLDGVSLPVTNLAINTTGGAGATASGTASFTFTAPAAGPHTLVASSTGTYAVPHSNSYALTTTPPIVLPPPGTAPPALSGIRVTQTAALWSGAKEGTPVAFCDPIGGIGPFLWGIIDPSGLYKSPSKNLPSHWRVFAA
jgi:hypothetical protein